MEVWGGILSAVALFVAGWSTRVYFERHKFNELKDQNTELKAELEVAKETQEHEIVIRGTTHADQVSEIELPDDEKTLLSRISRNSNSMHHRPTEWSDERFELNSDRLIGKSFVNWGTDGRYVTELGHEWLDTNGLIE